MKNARRVLVTLLLWMPFSMAFAAQEGQDYVRLRNPQPVEAPAGKIEVREFFWYGCPHCYGLEPMVERWLKAKPANVTFFRTPATFGNWVVHAQTFYTFENLGLLNKLHSPFFDALHRQNRRLNDEAAIAAWVAEQGVDAAKFKSAFQSFSVKLKLEKTKKQINDLSSMGLEGVPAFMVDGKFLVGAGVDPLTVVDELVKKVAAERAAGKKK